MPENGTQDSAGRLVTVNERLLLHLRDYALPRYREDVPPQVTQEGIAEALGIRPNHVPRAVRRLLDDGAVNEQVSHVSGFARRRKVYFLTEKGLSIAEGVLKRLSATAIEVETEDGERKRFTFQDAQYYLPGKPGITRLLRALGEDGIVRMHDSDGQQVHAEGIVDQSVNSPKPQSFFGRTEELQCIEGWLSSDGPRVGIISGVKGMGKTALVHKALAHARGKNVFWHTFHAWDSPDVVVQAFQAFSNAAMKSAPKLDASATKLPETIRALIPKFNAVAVFDNLFELREDTANLCHHLIEVFASTPGAKLIVTTRDAGLRQWFRAYASSSAVAELQLQGLDRESARELVEAVGGELPDFERVYAITSGHPLVLELVNSEEIRALVDDSGLTPEEALVLRCLKAFDYILG
ncbi:MAG: ATP-binding protein [Methanobacteriota archaeon]